MSRSIYQFVPQDHEEALAGIIEELLKLEALDPAVYEAVLRRHPRPEGGFFSKSHVIQGFRHLNRKRGWGLEERPFLEMMRMKPVRTQSGVAPVTVLTKPFPCPGRCIFCPSDVRMPKSYIYDEPGCQRAAANHFDPYLQTWNRLLAYQRMGHPASGRRFARDLLEFLAV